jgi:hypothetical protein
MKHFTAPFNHGLIKDQALGIDYLTKNMKVSPTIFNTLSKDRTDLVLAQSFSASSCNHIRNWFAGWTLVWACAAGYNVTMNENPDAKLTTLFGAGALWGAASVAHSLRRESKLKGQILEALTPKAG